MKEVMTLYGYPFNGAVEVLHDEVGLHVISMGGIIPEKIAPSKRVIPITDIKKFRSTVSAVADKAKGFVFDNLTSSSEMVKELAEALFMKSPEGKEWLVKLKPVYQDILSLPRGIGYDFMNKAYTVLFDFLMKTGKPVVILAGVKEKVIAPYGIEQTVLDIDAFASLNRQLVNISHSIGYVSKNMEGQTTVTFEAGPGLIAGSAKEQLSGKTLPLAELKTLFNQEKETKNGKVQKSNK